MLDWDRLCELVMNCFDKDQYQLLLKWFDALKQIGSVEDYQMEFEKLAQGILLYNSGYDDTYFVTRFVAGLKEEIRSVIALHSPRDEFMVSNVVANETDQDTGSEEVELEDVVMAVGHSDVSAFQ